MPSLEDRCTLRSEARDEPLAGTASTIRRWLLVESAGPWGRDGLLDGRLPDGIGRALRNLGRASRARVLLIRRPDRRPATDRGVTCFGVDAGASDPWIGRRILGSIDDAPALELDDRASFEPVDGPLAVVCTHGRRDACCAERGRPLAIATAAAFPETTWESTHVGGDRFAANLVAFPHALYFGHVEAVRGPEIVGEYAEGRIVLDRFRGRAAMPMMAQAADVYLRTRLGVSAVDGVSYEGAELDGDEALVRLRAAGQAHAVRVRRRTGDPMRLTCRSAAEEPPVTWEAVGLEG